MTIPGNTPAPEPPRRVNLTMKLIPIVALSAIALALIVNTILPGRWHPQLSITNTGTKPVTYSYKGGTFISQPGEIWHMRFYGGDTLIVRTNDDANAPSLTVALPAGNPKPWTLNPTVQRWTAEVNADDPQNIRFENRRYVEITAPPSEPQPWP